MASGTVAQGCLLKQKSSKNAARIAARRTILTALRN
jgi:hypothetical protein